MLSPEVAETTMSGAVHSLMYCKPELFSVQVGVSVKTEN